MSRPDIRQLIARLRGQGFTVEMGGKGHWKIRRAGRLITTIPATPSDRRGLANVTADLARAGYIPPQRRRHAKPKPRRRAPEPNQDC